MPSANRFALLRETVRNHPVVVASSAASAGVLLGGFVAFQLLAPTHHRIDSASGPQAVLASKGGGKVAPETTGSATTSERTASADCENETWPHLSPACVDEMRSKHRARVVSTDKLDKPTIEAIEASRRVSPTPVELQPAAPAVAATPPVSLSPVDLVAAPSAVFAEPDGSPAALTNDAPQTQPAADTEQKTEKHVATKSKRKPKAEPKAETKTLARQESDDNNADSVANDGSDERISDDRSDPRVDRRRIVQRRTQQEYEVPASDGDGERRVTVIRRNGGGLFESLFGN
jgi:hypothetical protein